LHKTQIKEKWKLFIQKLEMSPIEILISFVAQSKDKVFTKLLQSNRAVSSLLSTFTNIENAPVLLTGSQMFNIYGDLNQIIQTVYLNYKQSLLMQVMKMFGYIDILGNPTNLLHNLGTGFKDFFEKPAKGIVKGPLEGAKGVIDGSLSLVKHTVEGTFTTTSKITSGISKGILYITQDEEYINEREKKKITEKPKNFVEGIGYGLTSMAGGIFYGVSDIVIKPIQGAKKDKWAGFGKGMLQGLAGVVVKPISGLLELVSKTTEGIKNTVNDDDKIKMERLPRPFYGKFQFVRFI
jgi:vacuolar protein sorting-associated protein 13A/C